MTAIFARYLTAHLGIFEQWYIRFFISLIVTVVVFRRRIAFSKFLHLSRRESGMLLVRGLIGFVLAMWLYALSTHYASIGSVAAMQIVPMTAIFGVWLFREKVSLATLSLIVLSFVGAAIVAVESIGQLHFGLGELMSLASGALFSLSLVLRKKQTGELNNYELVVGTTFVAVVGNYLMNIVTGGSPVPHVGNMPSGVIAVLVIAGALSTVMSLFASYGFEHVKATTASIILNMELVFGVLFGYLLYGEMLKSRQFTGAFIILFASSAVAYLEAKRPLPETKLSEGEYNEQHASEIV